MEYQMATDMATQAKLFVTEEELKDFAKANFIHALFFIMPLPHRKPMSECRINHQNESRWQLFETDTGKSGWCCPDCGIIHRVSGE